MLYRIYAFDGLELTQFRQRGQADDMGTGNARTSYMRIPGGFYDHYGDMRSPQEVRPIVQEGELWADTTGELKDALLAIRAKLGVLGILTVKFADETLYWQNARLVQVRAPSQLFNFVSIPITLVFESSDQIWFKTIVTAEEWTWGDLSWTFGDGTAEFGESGTLEDLTADTGNSQEFTITHAGNIDAKVVAVVITAGTSDIEQWRYTNETTQRTMAISETIAAGEKLVINGGNRSVWLYSAAVNISSIFNISGLLTNVTTSANHGLSVGDKAKISGGTSWDGIHTVVSAGSPTTFTFSSKITGSESSGATQKATSKYGNFKQQGGTWPTLAPGDNVIEFTMTTGNTTQDATIAWEFYEQFA